MTMKLISDLKDDVLAKMSELNDCSVRFVAEEVAQIFDEKRSQMTQSPPTTPQVEPKPDFTGWVHNHAATGWKKVAELRLEISKLNRVIAKKNRKIMSLKADLAQPRAVEKVEYLETALMNAVKPAYKFHAHCPDCQVEFETDNGEWLIWCGTKEHAEAILQAARIVAAQQKKAIDPLAGTTDGVCS